MVVDVHRFSGFRPEAIDFLVELAQNNDRSWFQPRKAEYEALIKEPMEAFVAALVDVPPKPDAMEQVLAFNRGAAVGRTA